MKSSILTIIIMFFIGTVTALAAPLIGDTPSNFADYVATFAAMVAVIPVVVEFFRTKLNMSGLALQILSWAMGVVIAVAAYFLNMGIFAGILLWHALVIGAGAALAANGIANTGIIQTILNLIPGINIKSNKAKE